MLIGRPDQETLVHHGHHVCGIIHQRKMRSLELRTGWMELTVTGSKQHSILHCFCCRACCDHVRTDCELSEPEPHEHTTESSSQPWLVMAATTNQNGAEPVHVGSSKSCVRATCACTSRRRAIANLQTLSCVA